MNNFHNVNTAGWLEFPFSVNGHHFVSKVNPNYRLLPVIKAMGNEGFAKINQSAILELGVIADNFEEMASNLRDINEYASEVVLEVVA